VTDYRATPEQWDTDAARWPEAILELRAKVESLEDDSWKQAESIRFCFDELVKRIEALEANSKPTPNPSQIRSSLVERVADAIAKADDDGLTNMTWSYHARAAIHEVLSYLCEHELIGNYARRQLEQEAKL
jgi:hypothetical protein